MDAAGRRYVVRNGHLPPRAIQTPLGDVQVQQPRVRDRRPTDERETFRSAILPPPPSLEALRGQGHQPGDFGEALQAVGATTGSEGRTNRGLECPLHRQPDGRNVPHPLLGIFLQADLERLTDPQRHVVVQRGPVGVISKHRHKRVRHIIAHERPATGQHLHNIWQYLASIFVEHSTERPNIRATVSRLALGLLRRQIRRRPHNHTHLRGGCG